MTRCIPFVTFFHIFENSLKSDRFTSIQQLLKSTFCTGFRACGYIELYSRIWANDCANITPINYCSTILLSKAMLKIDKC